MGEFIKEREFFEITTLSEANWCFKNINRLNADAKNVKAFYDEEHYKIKAWHDKELDKINNEIEFFETQLKLYYKKLKDENPKAKLTTPEGKITSRKVKQWHYNEHEILAYLKENCPTMIQTVEKFSKSEFKKMFPTGVNIETGELLPVVITEEETFSFKGVE